MATTEHALVVRFDEAVRLGAELAAHLQLRDGELEFAVQDRVVRRVEVTRAVERIDENVLASRIADAFSVRFGRIRYRVENGRVVDTWDVKRVLRASDFFETQARGA